jgi:hypothetical protein
MERGAAAISSDHTTWSGESTRVHDENRLRSVAARGRVTSAARKGALVREAPNRFVRPRFMVRRIGLTAVRQRARRDLAVGGGSAIARGCRLSSIPRRRASNARARCAGSARAGHFRKTDTFTSAAVPSLAIVLTKIFRGGDATACEARGRARHGRARSPMSVGSRGLEDLTRHGVSTTCVATVSRPRRARRSRCSPAR